MNGFKHTKGPWVYGVLAVMDSAGLKLAIERATSLTIDDAIKAWEADHKTKATK